MFYATSDHSYLDEAQDLCCWIRNILPFISTSCSECPLISLFLFAPFFLTSLFVMCIRSPGGLRLVLRSNRDSQMTLTLTHYQRPRELTHPLLLLDTHPPPSHLPVEGNLESYEGDVRASRRLDFHAEVPFGSSGGEGGGVHAPFNAPFINVSAVCPKTARRDISACVLSNSKFPGRNSGCANLGSTENCAGSNLTSSGAQESRGWTAC